MESGDDSNSYNGKTKIKEKKVKSVKIFSKERVKWIITAFFLSFFITIIFSILSNELLNGVKLFVAILLLCFIIIIGIIFDIVAISITTADEKQFHSMASRKIKSAKHAIYLIRNADKMSSIFSDVIGDICGIISGATGAAIVVQQFSQDNMIPSLLITATIAAFTIGGKAAGKGIGLRYNNNIVNILSKIISILKKD